MQTSADQVLVLISAGQAKKTFLYIVPAVRSDHAADTSHVNGFGIKSDFDVNGESIRLLTRTESS